MLRVEFCRILCSFGFPFCNTFLPCVIDVLLLLLGDVRFVVLGPVDVLGVTLFCVCAACML